jgi:hypothetical protein
LTRRTVKVTKQHNEECRRLLSLMGIPVIVVREDEWVYEDVVDPKL